MLRLEVIGKLLLLLAGLPAVFDLIKPETLRRWSRRSRAYQERRKEFQIVAGISRLQYAIRLNFVRAKTVADPYAGAVNLGEELRWTPPNRSPVRGVSADEFAAFWQEVMDEIRERQATSERKAAGTDTQAAIRHVEKRIDQFLRRLLPPQEGRHVGKMNHYKAAGSRQAFNQVMVLLVILLGATVVANIIPTTRAWINMPSDGLTLPLVLMACALGIMYYSILRTNSPGSVEAVLLGCAATVLKWLASPLRPLRLAALFLFIAGSMIELVLVI